MRFMLFHYKHPALLPAGLPGVRDTRNAPGPAVQGRLSGHSLPGGLITALNWQQEARR
jgi:hypothetical protein